ncbi:MAG: CmcJ/NvfI family oxidoreductase [Pseudomonadota bacterium]
MSDTTGSFQFMNQASESSLFRNGRVLIERDSAGNTASSTGIELDTHQLKVVDARLLSGPAQLTCEVNGFELLQSPVVGDIDFLDHQSVVRDYYGQCERLVQLNTEAEVFAFDHNIRSARGNAARATIKGGQDVQGPAHVVHGDYTLRSAPERVQQLARPPSGNDTLQGFIEEGASVVPESLAQEVQDGRRFAIINVWRNIVDEPVETHPLALCDAATVVPDDLVVFELHYPDRVGENYFSKAAAAHKFYYYPHMTRDEALLIKQWDSFGALATSNGVHQDNPGEVCTFSFHSAFHPDDGRLEAPDRWSIEVRCIVIYP